MITSEIIINKMSIKGNKSLDDDSLDFNEKELHDTIDNVFKNVGEDKCNKKRSCSYFIKRIIFCKKNLRKK